MRLKNAFKIVLTLPMLIPSISHGWGLRMLFGTSGILTQWTGWDIQIFGLTGIVMGSVMYSFPIAFLMLSDVLGYEDASPYEAAEVLGINKVRQFTGITLPYLSKALISVIFSVFTMVVTDYGVPTTIGGTYNTLPVELLKAFNNLAERRSDLSIYSAILLMPAVAAFVIDLLKKEQNRSSFVNKTIKPRKNVARDILCYAVCILMCLVVVFPIIAFAAQAVMTDYPYNLTPSLVHIEKVLLKDGDTFLLFLLMYGASQVVLDSTRYDSLHFRSNDQRTDLKQIIAEVTDCGTAAHFVLIFSNDKIADKKGDIIMRTGKNDMLCRINFQKFKNSVDITEFCLTDIQKFIHCQLRNFLQTDRMHGICCSGFLSIPHLTKRKVHQDFSAEHHREAVRLHHDRCALRRAVRGRYRQRYPVPEVLQQ